MIGHNHFIKGHRPHPTHKMKKKKKKKKGGGISLGYL